MAIVCATDFSESSRGGVDVAASIAAKLGEVLHLLHVHDEESSRLILNPVSEVLKATVTERLREEAARARKRGANVREELVKGAPDQAVASFASSIGASLIVVAALGWRSASRWKLGSVAERTVQLSECPVLVIRNPDPFLAWIRGDQPLRVLLGVDFSDASDGAIRWLSQLQRIGPCRVTAGHVYRSGDPASEVLEQEGPETERAVAHAVRARLHRLNEADLQVRAEPTASRVHYALVALAGHERADLLLIGSDRLKALTIAWHDTVAYRALQLASTSVALVPTTLDADRLLASLPPLRTVLAATNFSPAGDRAVQYAYSLVNGGGTVELVHVVQPGEKESEESDLVERLRSLAPAAAAFVAGMTRIEVIEASDVAGAIGDAAQRSAADVICLGTSADGIGAIAAEVATHSERPILLVPPPAEEK